MMKKMGLSMWNLIKVYMEKAVNTLELDFEENLYLFSDAIKSQISPLVSYFLPPIFNDNKPLNIEIGIGNGEFITHYALMRPQENFIGFEVFRKIFRKAVSRAQKNKLTNVRLIQYDASFLYPFCQIILCQMYM